MVANLLERAQKEVDKNYEYFRSQLPRIKGDHLNEFVLLHDGAIKDFFNDEDDAIKIGTRDYGEGNFSVQQVNDSVINLGYQSYVIF